MRQQLRSDNEGISLAIEAADQLLDREPDSPGPSFEPSNIQEAQAAVQRLGERFEQLPGSIRGVLDAARSSGAQLSNDRLQGLAEIIQNADDAEASEVRFMLGPEELLATHNGNPVHLSDVYGMATPWLGNKADDPSAIGRFGIGLWTLQSISTTLEVHCAPYHVRIGDPAVTPVEPPDLTPQICQPGWTTLRIPIQAEVLQSAELEKWFDRWDDSSLLFLRHVARVTLLEPDGRPIRVLALSRHRDDDLVSSSGLPAISRELANASDGRSWALYSADVPSPVEASRTRKAKASITPIGVAIPLELTEAGQVYSGLPVAPTRQPLFANAQFDPITSRADFDDTPWNETLVHLVADVWSEAILDLFARDPQSAWQTVPLPCEGEGGLRMVLSLETAVITKARHAVASRLSFPVPGKGHVALSELAVEEQSLEGILQEPEIAKLAGLAATLPVDVRDPAGIWRTVLDDWRSHRNDLPEPVSVEQALNLVGDEGRPVHSTIELVAAGLQKGLGANLLKLPCLIAHDGRRLVPPTRDSTKAVSTETSPLAELLGVTTILHPAYSNKTNGAPETLEWLEECGALLDVSEDAEVVRRIARAGQSGNTINSPLADEQVRTLRDAFEHIDEDERQKIGPDVGRAIRLKSYSYDAEGGKMRGAARPVDAYLPRAITRDSDGFAVAADKAQGLVWLSDHYAKALRSHAERGGVGALKFLGLLGAETAPRLRPHAKLKERWGSWSRLKDKRPGLPEEVADGPEARSLAMRKLGATYTLEDSESPDLLAVMEEISRESHGEQRRTRAGALLKTLRRAWERLSKCAEVEAARDDRSWKPRGQISAFWLWQVREVAWLDDESGVARKPVELRLRTQGAEAIFGKKSLDYLHTDLDQQIRRDLLIGLGVSSDPSRSDLVDRLREIRAASSEGKIQPEDLRRASTPVYRALAVSLKSKPGDPADLNEVQLREEFARGHLVYTNLGWQSPQNVLIGTPIFKNLRAFAPAPKRCEALWDTLRLREPSQQDCLEVLMEIASGRENDPDEAEEAILLQTLRALAEHYTDGATVTSQEAEKLGLWTSMGWTQDRPVYATDDPVLAVGLGDRLPIWQPFGELKQFQPLLEPLGITEIQTNEAKVVDPEFAQEDHNLTELFQSAIELLRDDLQRNDPKLAQELTVPWKILATHVVRCHPSLALVVSVAPGQEYECEARAKVDVTHATVYVSEPAMLTRENGGGRALAPLFEGEPRRVAQAWLAACGRAEEGIEARRIELEYESVEPEDVQLDDDSRLAELQEQTAQNRNSSRKSAGRRAVGETHPSVIVAHKPEQRKQPPPVTAPRALVDPQSLTLINPEGRIDKGSSTAASGIVGRPVRSGHLNEPKGVSGGPSNRTPLRGYSDIDRENVGFEIFVKAVSTDQNKITDLRNERGVGADAVDQQDRFYELKVYANSEPDEVTLTDSEVRRAHTTSDFFLVVISNVEEGADGPITVRIVADPLDNLLPTDRGTITLSGLHKVDKLVYKFAQTDAQ